MHLQCYIYTHWFFFKKLTLLPLVYLYSVNLFPYFVNCEFLGTAVRLKIIIIILITVIFSVIVHELCNLCIWFLFRFVMIFFCFFFTINCKLIFFSLFYETTLVKNFFNLEKDLVCFHFFCVFIFIFFIGWLLMCSNYLNSTLLGYLSTQCQLVPHWFVNMIIKYYWYPDFSMNKVFFLFFFIIFYLD